MKYTDIRHYVQKHFRERLAEFKAQVDQSGPIGLDRVKAATDLMSAAESDRETFLQWLYLDDEERLLEEFCEREGIKETLTDQDRDLILRDYQLAYRNYVKAGLEYNAQYDDIQVDTSPPPANAVSQPKTTVARSQSGERLSDAITAYLEEGKRSELWVAKTLSEKQEALLLLSQLLEDKQVGDLSKADARAVKTDLQNLPKNRNKSPVTRGLTLKEMLVRKDLPKASIRTLNTYVSHYQTFFKWAVEQGFIADNIFEGMRFRMSKRDKAIQRDAFSAEQLQVMFEHLTTNPDNLVKKPEHKWVTLIAMFTGARLNEVAQLNTADLVEHQGVLCLSFTDAGDPNKRLKTEASKRLVPVHDTLLQLDIEGFVLQAKSKGFIRLFPALSYDKQNGYGRNVGRWFNESFLPRLDMKSPTLTFHCLRHTMNTQLGQKNTPEHLQKAILGHTQSGMSYSTYFKEGFLPTQLKPEVNKFSL